MLAVILFVMPSKELQNIKENSEETERERESERERQVKTLILDKS